MYGWLQQLPQSAGSTALAQLQSAPGDTLIDTLTSEDYVLVFQSKYKVKPKDSLRIYIPNLVWPTVDTAAKFHKWWKLRLLEQVDLHAVHCCRVHVSDSDFTGCRA